MIGLGVPWIMTGDMDDGLMVRRRLMSDYEVTLVNDNSEYRL